jgi:hypothetical protein
MKLIFTGSAPGVRKVWVKIWSGTQMFMPNYHQKEIGIIINFLLKFLTFKRGWLI